MITMTELLFEMLMDVLNEACQVRCEAGNIYWSDLGLSAYANACSWLEKKGNLKLIEKGKHKGLYKILKWEL